MAGKSPETRFEPTPSFSEHELMLAADLIGWMENEFTEERSLIGRPSIMVSANNTAKKREIFEAAAKADSLDRRKSMAAASAVADPADKSKFDESVDEIRDVLARLRPSSNFPCVQHTLEKLLVILFSLGRKTSFTRSKS
jgi:hypothetical protein